MLLGRVAFESDVVIVVFRLFVCVNVLPDLYCYFYMIEQALLDMCA